MINYTLFTTADAAGGGAAPRTRGVAVSSTNTYYSAIISGMHSDGYGVTFSWTGTPTGTISCWMSDVPEPGLTNDNDWVQDTAFTPSNPAGAASKFRDDAGNVKAKWKRFKYVNASGSGVLFGDVTVQRTA